MDSIISKNSFPAFAAIFVVIAMTTQASPTSPQYTIDNPCGLRDPSASNQASSLNMTEQTRGAIATLRNLVAKSQIAMNAYTGQDLLTEVERDRLMGPLSHISSLPTRSSPIDATTTLVQRLRQDYRDVSTFLVYLQHGQNQQLTYNGNTLRTELNEVKEAFLGVLCGLDSMLRQQGTILNDFVNSSDIPDDLKNMRDDKRRYERDFVLLKYTKVYVNTMISHYEDMLSDFISED